MWRPPGPASPPVSRVPVSRRLASCLVVSLILSGCGLPTRSEAVRVAPSELPHALSATRGTVGPTSGAQLSAQSRVFFVTQQAQLVPVATPVNPGADVAHQVSMVLDRLAAGPTPADRSRGLSSEIPPGSTMSVASIRAGVADIEWKPLSDGLEPRRGSLAAGQVVLTVTSISGVEDVQILRDGVPADVPLPGGELKAGPLRAADFAALIQPAPSPTSGAAAAPSDARESRSSGPR